MFTILGLYEQLFMIKYSDFRCVIALYFVSFFYEHPVYRYNIMLRHFTADMGVSKLSELVTRGDLSQVPAHVVTWLEQCADTCTPRDVHVMDGTPQEARELKSMLVRSHVMIPLPKYDNCYLVR